MFVFGRLKKRRREKLQAAAMEQMRSAVAIYEAEDPLNPMAKMEKMVHVLQAMNGLADAFDPKWRRRGKCELENFPELQEFSAYLGVIYSVGSGEVFE